MVLKHSGREHKSSCFLSLPHEFNTVRDAIKTAVKKIGGDSYFVIVSEGDTLRNEIVRGLSHSSILIADLSSAESQEEDRINGPRPAIMWEIGYADAAGLGRVFLCQNKDKHYVPPLLSDFHIIYYDINNIPKMVEELEGTLEKQIIREKTTGYKIFQSKCYINRNSCDLEVRYLKAEESIKILELNLETVDSQASTIIKAMELNPKLSVQILTLNPFSKFAENRANQLAELPLIYRRRLYQTIESTYNKLNTISQKRWEIRIYDTFPTQIMFQIDKALIHSIISLGRRSRDMLHFEVQASRPNASDTFEAHFAQLWSQGVDYKEWFKRNKKDVVNLLETGNSESTHKQRRQRTSQNNKIIKKA